MLVFRWDFFQHIPGKHTLPGNEFISHPSETTLLVSCDMSFCISLEVTPWQAKMASWKIYHGQQEIHLLLVTFRHTPTKFNMVHLTIKGDSFWKPSFSGSMLNFQGAPNSLWRNSFHMFGDACGMLQGYVGVILEKPYFKTRDQNQDALSEANPLH